MLKERGTLVETMPRRTRPSTAMVAAVGRQVNSFVAMDKEYSGVLRLGQTTPSMDSETEPDLERPWAHLSDVQLAAAAADFEGDTQQLPPMFSAIKIKGANDLTTGDAHRVFRRGIIRSGSNHEARPPHEALAR